MILFKILFYPVLFTASALYAAIPHKLPEYTDVDINLIYGNM